MGTRQLSQLGTLDLCLIFWSETTLYVAMYIFPYVAYIVAFDIPLSYRRITSCLLISELFHVSFFLFILSLSYQLNQLQKIFLRAGFSLLSYRKIIILGQLTSHLRLPIFKPLNSSSKLKHPQRYLYLNSNLQIQELRFKTAGLTNNISIPETNDLSKISSTTSLSHLPPLSFSRSLVVCRSHPIHKATRYHRGQRY